VDVEFPDGTRITTLSIYERKEHDDRRDFGLYMYETWQPTWPAEVIPWPDFSVPTDWEGAAAQIEAAFARAKAGQNVEIGCRVGLGRTGTVLACMAFLAGVPASEAVSWVRDNYNPGAVETSEQEAWVRWFAQHFANRSPLT
jgi:protein-tyrosine phosphatase